MIDCLAIRLNNALNRGSREYMSILSRACNSNRFVADFRGVLVQRTMETAVEDCFGDGEEDGTTDCLREDENGEADGVFVGG